MLQRETLRDLAVAAAAAAGELVARAHARPGTLTTEVKSPGDYVTDVDRSAERAAIEVLVKARLILRSWLKSPVVAAPIACG